MLAEHEPFSASRSSYTKLNPVAVDHFRSRAYTIQGAQSIGGAQDLKLLHNYAFLPSEKSPRPSFLDQLSSYPWGCSS